MPYYTGGGDEGATGLCDSKKVSKHSPRVVVFGEVDELNSFIGWCRVASKDKDENAILQRIQNDLFVLGSDIAAPLGSEYESVRITEKQIKWMEEAIDGITKEIGEQKCFILPGGSELAARLHMARAVCRRAERVIVLLSGKEKINETDLPYINRLSSLLFVMAKMANERAKVKDIEWKK
jgi:cob(I)alamin adenosyltransferase